MSFFGFGQSADIEIHLQPANRKTIETKTEDGKKEQLPLYYDGENVNGQVNIVLKRPGSKLDHQGIKIEFIGQIEMFYDRGNHHEFIALVKELARPGEMIANTSFQFDFQRVEKSYEIYTGSNVRLRYFLKVTIIRRLADIVKERDIAVHTLSTYPELNNSIKMEVGIEDCLHIEFEYNKSKYHLKDVIVGKIYFLLVRIKIKHMEIAIIKKETTGGGGGNAFTENETIAKYEIMDGGPVRGESIPIRVFLAGYELTPTMRDVNKKFSVRYFLNLVLMDTEERRYFKQQEITLWRKGEGQPTREKRQLLAGTQTYKTEETDKNKVVEDMVKENFERGNEEKSTTEISSATSTGETSNESPTAVNPITPIENVEKSEENSTSDKEKIEEKRDDVEE